MRNLRAMPTKQGNSLYPPNLFSIRAKKAITGNYDFHFTFNTYFFAFCENIFDKIWSADCSQSKNEKNAYKARNFFQKIAIHFNSQGKADTVVNKYFLLLATIIPYSAYWKYLRK